MSVFLPNSLNPRLDPTMRLNRDVIVATVLLLICSGFLYATGDIPKAIFNQMSSALWPRIILTPLIFLLLIYLGRSLMQTKTEDTGRGGLKAWFLHYRNPIYCYLMFFIFLLTLPYFGMLIGGILFVFFMLSILGGFSPRLLILHGVIATISVGAMWSLFVFALGVILPRGEIFTYY